MRKFVWISILQKKNLNAFLRISEKDTFKFCQFRDFYLVSMPSSTNTTLCYFWRPNERNKIISNNKKLKITPLHSTKLWDRYPKTLWKKVTGDNARIFDQMHSQKKVHLQIPMTIHQLKLTTASSRPNFPKKIYYCPRDLSYSQTQNLPLKEKFKESLDNSYGIVQITTQCITPTNLKCNNMNVAMKKQALNL